MAKRAPWFAFDVHDWLTSIDIQRMTLAEVGAYINLLARAWDADPIASLPNDPAKLWKFAGARTQAEFDEVAPAVLALFEEREDRLVNVRMLEEVARLEESETERNAAWEAGAAARAEKAKRAADARWGKNSQTGSSPDARGCSSMLAMPKTETETDKEKDRSDSESPEAKPRLGSKPKHVASLDQSPSQLRSQPDEHVSDWAIRMGVKWRELRRSVGYDIGEEVRMESFMALTRPSYMERHGCKPASREEVERVMVWALTVSRRPRHPKDWGNPNVLDGTPGFVNAWKVIRAQCFNYNSAKITKDRSIGATTVEPESDQGRMDGSDEQLPFEG